MGIEASAVPESASVEVSASPAGRRLRVSEKVVLAYFAFASIAATAFQVAFNQGLTMAALNVITGGVILEFRRRARSAAFPSGTAEARSSLPPQLILNHHPHPASGATLSQKILGARASRLLLVLVSRRLGCKSGRDARAPRDSETADHGSEWLAAVRNWFPALMILLAFREAGALCLPDTNYRLDQVFERWDLVVLHSRLVLGVLNHGAPWVERYLEFCYLLCYPMVPLGFGALLLGLRRRKLRREGIEHHTGRDRGRRRGRCEKQESGATERAIDRFWTTILLAALGTYALFPFFPTTPPRLLFHDFPGPVVAPLLRKLNFWILGNFGIPSSVFPSGHVAAVTATALAVRAELPRLGIVFLVAAASITAATVYCRYHYTADAVVGALVATVAFYVARRIHGHGAE